MIKYISIHAYTRILYKYKKDVGRSLLKQNKLQDPLLRTKSKVTSCIYSILLLGKIYIIHMYILQYTYTLADT